MLATVRVINVPKTWLIITSTKFPQRKNDFRLGRVIHKSVSWCWHRNFKKTSIANSESLNFNHLLRKMKDSNYQLTGYFERHLKEQIHFKVSILELYFLLHYMCLANNYGSSPSKTWGVLLSANTLPGNVTGTILIWNTILIFFWRNRKKNPVKP